MFIFFICFLQFQALVVPAFEVIAGNLDDSFNRHHQQGGELFEYPDNKSMLLKQLSLGLVEPFQ